jgi:hypothetical protein
MTDAGVAKTLRDMEDVIRFRLRVREIIPVEMSQYRIRACWKCCCLCLCIDMFADDGRAFFTVPNSFETSISLTGAGKEDGWFFVHAEFLHNVGGDLVSSQGALPVQSHLAGMTLTTTRVSSPTERSHQTKHHCRSRRQTFILRSYACRSKRTARVCTSAETQAPCWSGRRAIN